MLRYVLVHSKGKPFDRLVKFIKYHSLSDLLMEMMQLTVGYQESPGQAAQLNNFMEANSQDETDENTEEFPATKQTGEQQEMMILLEQKKRFVIRELIMVMSHKNYKDCEASLNASSVLIELIETEKTFQIFMNQEGELARLMLTLAVDPSNQFNQQYLL